MIRVGDIEVDRDLAMMRVLATGLEESLTPKEVRIMQVLTLSANKTIGRDELIGKVWAGVRVSTSTIDSHMSRLRRKIEQSFECRLETEYGSGWKLAVRNQ
jgi:DNA-binding response OmpR family regulator